MRTYFKRRDEEQDAALDRIKVLFDLARQEFPKNKDRANRYAKMINDIISKVRVRPDRKVRMFICSKCDSLLVPGSNLSVRSEDGFMVYTCLDCGNVKKYGYANERLEQ